MKRIRDYIFKDFKLKALSLVLAAMLWFAISYIGDSKMTISVPVVTENMGKGLIIEKMGTDEVLVTIDGPISLLKNLKAREIKVSVNLSGVREGAHVFALEKEDVTVPKGIKVEGVRPDYMTMNIYKALEKELKVVVKLEEGLGKGYGVRSWYPHYVKVEGPEAALRDRNAIETVPVKGDFGQKEEEIDVPLAVKGTGITKTIPETVRVRLRRK